MPADNNVELTKDGLKTVFVDNDDLIFKDIYINSDESLCITLVYIDGMVNTKIINDDILKPLIQEIKLSEAGSDAEMIGLIEHGTVYSAPHKTRTDIKDCVSDVIDGSAALVFDNENKAVTFEVKGFERRAISEPTYENVYKGAKDSFVETLRVNTATLRRRIKTSDLRIVQTTIGKQSQTTVAIIYIEGITNKNLIEEVKKRLEHIDIDTVASAGHIEEYIVDNKNTMFPLADTTERPDKLCANIIEGRVGLIIEGMPVAYIVPATLNQLMQAPEDYSYHYIVASALRTLRYLLLFVELFLPGFYISVTSFNIELLPTTLALSLVASKEGVPFPSFVEVFIMLAAFEVLLEAGQRLPKTIAQAVSIVGALVLGEAAVVARIVSPGIIIIIALVGMAGFTMPNRDLSNALRAWRFFIAVLASIAGLFGVTIGALILLYHFCALESFGVPYLSPFVTADSKSILDTIFRFPLYLHKKRPEELRTENKSRQK